MLIRKAEAIWQGKLRDGNGTVKLGSGAFEGSYSFASRFEDSKGTNPEELIGAAHAGCFSMALSAMLEKAGHEPKRIHTTASVRIEKVEGEFTITHVDLETQAQVPGIDEGTFLKIAEQAKGGCPVSRALAGVEIALKASVEG